MTLHLNIGSNLGDRHANVLAAARAVAAELGIADLRLSDPVESDPWGYDSPNRYINIAASGTVADDTDPARVLAATQGVERRMGSTAHRHADGSYADRTVDIDIIALGRTVTGTPDLTLPHPRAHLRPWVLGPLSQLSPDTAKWIEESSH